jgi:hypothetical protein
VLGRRQSWHRSEVDDLKQRRFNLVHPRAYSGLATKELLFNGLP